MRNFIKSFTKVQKNKISLSAQLHFLASSSINVISCVSQDLSSVFSLSNCVVCCDFFFSKKSSRNTIKVPA